MSTADNNGLDQDRLAHLKAVIEQDIAEDQYFGAVIAVARHGELGMLEAIGWGDQEHKVPLQTNSVFSLFSLTKAFTNTLVYRAIELGQFSLMTRVTEIIPEFDGEEREKINLVFLNCWAPFP